MENEPRLSTGIDRVQDGLRLDPKTEAGEKFASDLAKMIEHGYDEDKAIELLASAPEPYSVVFYTDGVEFITEGF